MLRLVLVFSMFIFLSAVFIPNSNNCTRTIDESGLWWGRSDNCEVLDITGEDCTVCTHGTDEGQRPTNVCFLVRLLWKFEFYKPSGNKSNIQKCRLHDHCKMSYSIQLADSDKSRSTKPSYENYICGTAKKDGKREQRGECKSAYGTYICECYENRYGRDCNDEEGAYATGVQALLNVKVRVSDEMTILIAVKEKGNDCKVHVNLPRVNVTITITEPIINDPSSKKLITYCEQKTELKTLCTTFLKESTSMYSVTLRFPLVRDPKTVWYYETLDDKIGTPIGSMENIVITTTNTIKGVERESFYRTNYNRNYGIVVKYPVDIGCYKNTQIVNCIEVQNKVNIYDASSEIVVHGDLSNTTIHEGNIQDKLKCDTIGEKTVKWTLFQVMSDGRFTFIDQFYSANAFEFVIKPYSLRTGLHVVEFSYTMATKWDVRENFDQCYFTVVEAPLIAIIEGGRSKYVDVDSVIILDGRRSYDPNIEGENSKVGLNFEWRCATNETKLRCLENYISPGFGLLSLIKLPPYVLEANKGYIISLTVTKKGKTPVSTSQTLVTGSKGNVQSIEITCINCDEGNTANPTDFIYLLAKVVLKPNSDIESLLKLKWTYSTHPAYPPDSSTDSIRVNQTSQELLKIDKNKLKYNNTYTFRVEIQGNKSAFSEIDIHTFVLKDFRCTLSPDSGVVAVTNFTLNCSLLTGFTYEVYDKSLDDPNYYSGRMLFTDLDPTDNYFKLTGKRVVVYGYDKYKRIEEWSQEVNLTPFNGSIMDIDFMVLNLSLVRSYPQRLLHSASVIPGALKPEMNSSSINLLMRLVSVVGAYQDKLKHMLYIKLILSSMEFILVKISENDGKFEFNINIQEAKICADIISAIANSVFDKMTEFDKIITLTETILHQMIKSQLNVIEIVLTVQYSTVFLKPVHFVNPYVLHLVKDITYDLVNALYKSSTCLLWRQIQGDSATEIVSTGSNITEWAMVDHPKVLYELRGKNVNIPFNFSSGFYRIMENLDILGIQITNLKVNPFWWAGGDINTNILLVDICFKVSPTQCKYRRTFYKHPLYLYFNISQSYNAIKPLKIHTVYLNLTKPPRNLDLDITVYRFDPPKRAKLFIQFEFENSKEDYKVLFRINERPDFDMINQTGITINNETQSKKQFVKYTRDEGDKLYYMGIIPVHQGSPGKRVTVTLKIVYTVCKTWLRWKWGSERCWVGEQESTERTLRCDCNHLSMFAGAVQVPPYILNPALEFMLFLTEEFNWIPLLVLIIITLVFIMLYVWGWRKDRKDSSKGIVTILGDNYPGESFAYLLGVYTGSRINSSTDANVGVKLFGEKDSSRAHILKHTSCLPLRGNSDDWFLLYSPVYLGTLESLHVWHDNSGKSPDWFVEKIEVYDLTDKFEYIFELNIWLALGVNEFPDAVVATSSLEDIYNVKRVFLSNVVTGFRDTNYWTSIFWKHARNPVKRVHRISVVLCFIMVAMICTVIVYHFNKGEEYEEDDPSYELNYNDFIIFIITLFLSAFTACLLMFLFRKSFSHRYERMQSSLFMRPEAKSEKSTAFKSLNTSERSSRVEEHRNLARLSTVSLYDSTKPRFIDLTSVNLNEKTISLGLRGKRPNERSTYENFVAAVHAIVRGSTLEPVRLPKYRNNVVLHKIYFTTAWVLFIVIVLVAIAVVIAFGHQIPKVESEKWATIFISVLLFDCLILSTLKILVCSVILGFAFQRLIPASYYKIKPEDGLQKNLIGDINHLFKIAQIRSHPMYCPLNEKVKEMYRQKCVKREQWKTLIDFVVVIMLIFVLVMLTTLSTVSLYRTNDHASWMLTKGPFFDYQNFTNFYNRTLFSNFLIYNFIHQLHRSLWYTQEDPLNDNDHMRRVFWTQDCIMRLLGKARIRQLRVILGECSKVNYFEDMEEYCSPPWSLEVEDTGTYSSRWFVGGDEDVRRESRAWRYTDAARSNSSVSRGHTLTTYPSGGYLEDLGFTKDDLEDALSSLILQHWLDHTTRAVFVELTLYNVNTGLFTQVVLVAEQMPTGEYLLAVKAESISTDFTFDIWKLSYSVFFIFFLVRMCVLTNRRGVFVYFSKIISLFEAILLTLGFLILFFYLIHITTSTDYVKEFHRSGFDEFFNFYNLISYIVWSRTVLCILFLCVVIRMLISLRFGRIFFTFYYTFLLSMPWVVWLVLFCNLYLAIIRRLVGHLLNVFVFTYSNSVIIYYKDSTSREHEVFSNKALVFSMCLLSYVVILLFIASFTYYYTVGKVYKLIDVDNLNFFTFLKENIKRRKNK